MCKSELTGVGWEGGGKRMTGMCERNWPGRADGERSRGLGVSKYQTGDGHMTNAARPDLSSKSCGSARARATDRR